MFERWFRSIKTALKSRWDDKLPVLLAQARNFSVAGMARVRSASASERDSETERVIREAYVAGYRQAYFDCMVDVVECGLDHEDFVSAPVAEEGVH